jgi:hypothetical protein
MKEPKTTPSSAKAPASWIASRSRPAIALILGGAIVVAVGAAWIALDYWRNSSKSGILVFHLCIGADPKLCPNDATFVRNEGEDTMTKWAQKQCTGYKARRIIINDGPTKDCGCSLVDVTCSSE